MQDVEKLIKYEFKNKELLNKAVTHSSFAHKNNIKNNERLEFLGDSIIGFLIAEYLLKNYNLKEGELSKIRAKIVSCENLSKIITDNGLDKFIKTFPSSLMTESIKGDFFEALVGAIYLDSNLATCKKFVFDILQINKDNVDKLYLETNDYKTKLQEYVQAKKGKLEYKLISEEGKANNLTFDMALYVNDKFVCNAKEKSKQKAENLCAKIALKNVDNLFD